MAAMGATRLIVCDGEVPADVDVAGADLMQFAAFIEQVRNLRWLAGALFGWREVGLVVPFAGRRPRPFAVALVLRLLSRGGCWIRDPAGGAVAIGPVLLAKLFARLLRDGLARPAILLESERAVADLRRWVDEGPRALALKPGPPVYLKTDLWLATTAGGSVTHMAGVVNHLGEFFEPPLVFAPAANPLLAAAHEFHLILPEERYWDYLELPALAFNARARRLVREAIGGRSPAFLYVRYGLNSYAGVALARDLGVPLVLEYNGSEIWADRHWGRAPARGPLAEEIEELCLAAANLIVVVSEPLRRELRDLGVPNSRILVNPNGVDPEVFRPDVEARALRASLGLAGRRVVGFIGTFGPWHGTELLVEAYALCRERHPEWRETTRLLLIGDGARRPATEALVDRLGLRGECVFTGLVPQGEGPRYLACCDLLVAPTLPNADGSAFFGSPTKVFEYLAMGKPVVASRLGQIGEVIEHGRTGWLVAPGDAQALADGIERVADNAALADALGREAREAVLARHSWRAHAGRIATAVKEACP